MKKLKPNNRFSYLLISISTTLLLIFTFALMPSSGDIKKPSPKKKIEGNKYVGAGSCASSNCHDSGKPINRAGININQNEFSIWFAKDSHRKAYDILLEPISQQIGRNLNLPDAPEDSEKCLVCHTTYAPAALWGKQFDFSDGVSCESCHGAAEKWLGQHTESNWNKEKAANLGMSDTENLFNRAEICLGCHIGNKNRNVDHELIAAGHPDLNRFEFDTFLALMPPHWRKSEENGDNAWSGVEIWSVGQTSALKQSMEQLSNRSGNNSSSIWPEFAEFNCYSCHHGLEDDSWRQALGYSARTPGFPAWNSARYVLLKPLADRVSPNISNDLEKQVATLSYLMDKVGTGNPSQISDTAKKISELVINLENQLPNITFDQNITYDLLLKISGNGSNIAKAGIRSAQQAAVALETLYYTYSNNVQGKNNQQIKDSIDKLFNYLERPDNFRPSGYTSQMNNINQLLKSN